MAVITVSAAGGNWNSTGTWVGGVVPLTTDSIAADATSGNLTVNINASVQFANFSGYTGTLTINNNNTLTLTLASSTTTFGSGMSYSFAGSGSSQGRIVKGNTAMTFVMLGTTPIPQFNNTGAAILTAGSDLYFQHIYSTAANLNVAGNNVYISGDLNMGFNQIGGTTTYNMVGTGTITVLQTGISSVPCNFVINTAGTITISSQGFGLGTPFTTNSNISFTHTAGTIVNPTFRAVLNNTPSTNTLNLISGTTWDFYHLNQGASYTLAFSGNPVFDKFVLSQASSSSNVQTFTISGANVLINELNILNGLTNIGGTFYKNSLDFVINPACNVTVNSFIDLNGGSNKPNAAQTPPLKIRSSVAGTPAVLNVNTYSQYVSRTAFTDINCSGGNTLYGQNLTLSNTTKISQYTLPPTGGGETSSVFIT